MKKMSSPEDQNMDMSDVKSALNQTVGLDESGSADNSSPKSSREDKSKDKGSLSSPRNQAEYNEDASPCKHRNIEKKMINVSYKNVKYSWETNGDESISDWVMRNLLEIGFKPPSDKNKLIFRNSVSGAIVNIGWDASILKEKENYKCEFCSPTNAKQSMCRNDFPDSIDFSEVKSFKIKNKGSTISLLHRFQDIEFLQVNFLPGESLYEALYRDGRFDNTILQYYNLQLPKEDDKTVLLSISADNYAEHDFKFSKRRPHPNATLQVKPYKGNQQTGKPADSIEVKTEPSENQVKAGTSGVLVKEETSEDHEKSYSATRITSNQELLDFITKFMLNLKIDPKNKKKRLQKIDKLFETSYDNYALKDNHRLYTDDHEFIVKVCHSVGAVVALYTSKVEAFKGTCFRIGKQFVLTNMHVVDLINEKSSLLENVYIDFDYGEPSRTNGVFRCDRHQYSKEGKFVPVVSSSDLDYAVLKLESVSMECGVPLPPSLTSMFSLPMHNQHLQEGIFLTFVGHPGGDKTSTNLCCPVRNPGNLAEEFAITLSRQNMETYDVSTFFHGSSGSPGFLIRERMLFVMHTRGEFLHLDGRSVEQGVMISAIVLDVCDKINSGLSSNYELENLFN